MSTTRYRLLFLGLGLALVLVVLFAVVFTPGGSEFRLPDAVQSISPGNDVTVQRQIDLVVDMAAGYRIELFIDGVPIPESEISITEATGRHTWNPEDSFVLPDWGPGLHSVHVEYESIDGRADFGSVSWRFRVQ